MENNCPIPTKWKSQTIFKELIRTNGNWLYIDEKASERHEGVIRGSIRLFDHKPTQFEQRVASVGRLIYDINTSPIDWRTGDNIPRLGYMIDIILDEKDRQKGIGQQMVKIAEIRMKCYGAEESMLDSARDAKDFWSKMGYKVAGERLPNTGLKRPINATKRLKE